MTLRKNIAAVVIGAAVLAAALFSGFASTARADVVIFLTRLNGIIATYPTNNALTVGTTTVTTAKLMVSLNVTDTANGVSSTTTRFSKAFEIASTTGTGTATTSSDIFVVHQSGCIQLTATSSATPIKLKLTATTSNQISGTNGVALWAYGTCP